MESVYSVLEDMGILDWLLPFVALNALLLVARWVIFIIEPSYPTGDDPYIARPSVRSLVKSSVKLCSYCGTPVSSHVCSQCSAPNK